MGDSVMIAIQIYLVAFVVAILIAGLIRGMLIVIRRVTPKEETRTKEREGSV